MIVAMFHFHNVKEIERRGDEKIPPYYQSLKPLDPGGAFWIISINGIV